MIPWIYIQPPYEPFMADYKSIFDAWEDGGVRGIVVGPMTFKQDDGSTIPAFTADPKVIEPFGVAPPPPHPRDAVKEKQMHAMLNDAASRGWHVMIFVSNPDVGRLPMEQDPYGAVSYAAGVEALMSAFPQARGQIVDGPGENHYELSFHHGGEVFEIPGHWRQLYAHLGFDHDRMEKGMQHVRDRFRALTPDLVRYHAPGGMLGALQLFDLNEDALYWLRMRQRTSLDGVTAMRNELKRLSRPFEWGCIPRTAAFSSLTGQNYHAFAPLFEYIFPKHYFWHRGFDGLYGTVSRWVDQLGRWNPDLSEADCFAVVKAVMGLDLPGVETRMDMELGFPDAFFSEIVHSETRRALAAVGDEDKVIAWVSTGRSPHAGDPMPAHDLQRILTASRDAGLKRFLFHCTLELGAAEWRVISSMCGRPWVEDPDGYWPLDTENPNTAPWMGHRRRE